MSAQVRPDNRLTAAFVVVALVALFGGVVTGLFQSLEHAGVDVFPSTPLVKSYYHSVTLHGVLNVLVWTTFFICGFVPFIAVRALERPLASYRLAWATFWLMLVGLIIAAIPLLGNAATVMFTFYPPLKAHWAFYLGLTLVVVGTWLVTLNLALTWRAWRRRNPAGRRRPGRCGSPGCQAVARPRSPGAPPRPSRHGPFPCEFSNTQRYGANSSMTARSPTRPARSSTARSRTRPSS